MKKIATIDIGTNTFLLLISEFDDNGNMKLLHHEQRIPRIGRDVDENKNIRHDAFIRAAEILNDYKKICLDYGVDCIAATGTSALRDAHNKNDFVSFIKNETGIMIEVIDGVEEALWSYRGGLSFFNLKPNQNYSVIDIGGGSTEIILGLGGEVTNRISLNVGSVRLTERFLKSDPPSENEIQEMRNALFMEFDKVSEFKLGGSNFVGVAGTVTTLAMIDRKEDKINPERLSGYVLSHTAVTSILDMLKKATVRQIEEEYHVQKGRSDIILAGNVILHSFMDKFNIPSVITSICGLRHGIALREYEKK
jgi:exopolyphosphatase/guanosine-5'-triphosphate,3'-diphosphate pyrophosphatase